VQVPRQDPAPDYPVRRRHPPHRVRTGERNRCAARRRRRARGISEARGSAPERAPPARSPLRGHRSARTGVAPARCGQPLLPVGRGRRHRRDGVPLVSHRVVRTGGGAV